MRTRERFDYRQVTTPTALLVVDQQDLKVTRTTFTHTTRYHVRGTTLTRIEEHIRSIKANYPSMGYGTWQHPMSHFKPGWYEVIVDRSNSSD